MVTEKFYVFSFPINQFLFILQILNQQKLHRINTFLRHLASKTHYVKSIAFVQIVQIDFFDPYWFDNFCKQNLQEDFPRKKELISIAFGQNMAILNGV